MMRWLVELSLAGLSLAGLSLAALAGRRRCPGGEMVQLCNKLRKCFDKPSFRVAEA